MDEQKIQVPLRLDRELHDRLRQAARQRDRSMNNLVVMVLRTWLDEQDHDAPREGPR
jgi:hypothetical protein